MFFLTLYHSDSLYLIILYSTHVQIRPKSLQMSVGTQMDLVMIKITQNERLGKFKPITCVLNTCFISITNCLICMILLFSIFSEVINGSCWFFGLVTWKLRVWVTYFGWVWFSFVIHKLWKVHRRNKWLIWAFCNVE